MVLDKHISLYYLCCSLKSLKILESHVECQSLLLCSVDVKKEIWRLRFNWLFLCGLGSLYAISYTSISSSFHQFVTNPPAYKLNGTNVSPCFPLRL